MAVLASVFHYEYGTADIKHCFIFVGWRRGSVVRMSVCSRRTFPDLRLIHG